MYFQIVNLNNNIFRISAKLLIAASVLCVMFGNGAHLHPFFDHISDHGDIHAYMHAHPADSDHDHAKEFDGKDDHQHATATVDITATLTQKTVSKSFTNDHIINEAGVIPSVHSRKEVNPLFLDLPPPDLLVLSVHFSSLSLRGPPLG